MTNLLFKIFKSFILINYFDTDALPTQGIPLKMYHFILFSFLFYFTSYLCQNVYYIFNKMWFIAYLAHLCQVKVCYKFVSAKYL